MNNQLKHRLDSLVQKGTDVISSWRKKKCFHQTLASVLRNFYLFPLAVWGWHFIGKVTGAISFDLGFGLFFLASVILAVAYLAVTYFLRSTSIGVSRSEALVYCDQQLGVKDRLVAADEFLDANHSGRFQRAALVDADQKAEEAEAHQFQPIEATFQNHASNYSGPILGILAMILLFFLVTPPNPVGTDPAVVVNPASDKKTIASEKKKKESEEKEAEVLQPVARPNPPKDQGAKTKSSESKKTESQQKDPSKERSESFQKISGNQASQAQSASSSNGTGSNPQPQTGENKEEKKKDQTTKQKRKPSGKKKSSRRQEPKPQKPAGVMSGKGTGKASNSENEDLPSFPKAAKAASNPEDDADDSDTDDEDEQQKSESGNKPTLNNKKPAPSREAGGVSPPPGDQASKSKKPPQRGGRSGVKKSRGVPSAILGVPTPDRLTGTPNASRFKIKQEESSPKEEVVGQVQAAARLSRSGLIGGLAHPTIPLWQQKIIENYFRQKNTNQNPTQKNNK